MFSVSNKFSKIINLDEILLKNFKNENIYSQIQLLDEMKRNSGMFSLWKIKCEISENPFLWEKAICRNHKHKNWLWFQVTLDLWVYCFDRTLGGKRLILVVYNSVALTLSLLTTFVKNPGLKAAGATEYIIGCFSSLLWYVDSNSVVSPVMSQ